MLRDSCSVTHETWLMRRDSWDVTHETSLMRRDSWDVTHETWLMRRDSWVPFQGKVVFASSFPSAPDVRQDCLQCISSSPNPYILTLHICTLDLTPRTSLLCMIASPFPSPVSMDCYKSYLYQDTCLKWPYSNRWLHHHSPNLSQFIVIKVIYTKLLA